MANGACFIKNINTIGRLRRDQLHSVQGVHRALALKYGNLSNPLPLVLKFKGQRFGTDRIPCRVQLQFYDLSLPD